MAAKHYNKKVLTGALALLLTFHIAYSKSKEDLLNCYDVHYYWFNLEVSPLNAMAGGNVEIHLEITKDNTDTLAIELTNAAIVDSILLNDEKTSFIHDNDLIIIPLPSPLNKESPVVLNFFYAVDGADFPKNEGISHAVDANNFPVTWTLSEPFYSKNWFPCKQVLSDKIDSVRLCFTCPEGNKVGSNGTLTAVDTIEPGKLRFEWKTSYPIAFYLISFAVSDYMDYSIYAPIGETDSVLVQNFIYNDSTYLAQNKANIDATRDMISLFSDLVGPYPFSREKYGHCVAPILGGMEHLTMTTLSDFRFNLVSHELAHQWFGDAVTCSSWQDIWINEGFASYFELIAIEFLRSEAEYSAWLADSYYLIISAPDGSTYVPESKINSDSRIFSHRLTYEKGAYILHMLRHEVGNDELFFQALKNYLEEYKGSVASGEDFRASVEHTTGKDLSTFFEQWYYGEGFPTVDIDWSQKSDTLSLQILQTVSAENKTPFFVLPIDLRISYYGGDTLIQVVPQSVNSTIDIPLNKRIYQVTPDPEKWLLAVFRSVTRSFNVDSTTSFSVFPNPVQDEVIIENYQIGLPYQAKLFSINGVLLDSFSASDVFSTFNTSRLNKGIYQIVLTRNDVQEVYQISKL